MFHARYAVVTMSGPRLCGLVLAAGAGHRFGGPKVLARNADGTPWVAVAVRMLRDAGCERVLVALGAGASEAAGLVPEGAEVVPVDDWVEGVAASLRAGLRAAGAGAGEVLVVTPVDTPDAPPLAVARLVEAVAKPRSTLVQAVYGGVPGHPVLLGRDHWDALAASVSGDRGARPYLVAHGVVEVECGDLWSGADVDTPQAGA